MKKLSLSVICGLILSTLTLTASAQAQLLPPILSSIFGPDNRFAANVLRHPYNAIVSLSIPHRKVGASSCTGGWVGDRWVLTAAHCLDEMLENSLITVRTADGRAQTTARGPFLTARGWTQQVSFGHGSEDWALIQLPRELGPRGWLPIDAEFTVGPRFTQPIILAGFSSDWMNGRQLSVHENCLVMQARRNGTFGHDCDMTRGASGAPVLHCEGGPAAHRCAVIGVNVTEHRPSEANIQNGSYSHRNQNGAVQARMFAAEVAEAMAAVR